MSFINANTANPTNSSQIGYQQETQFFNSNLNSGSTNVFPVTNNLTQGVWLINACAYMQTNATTNTNGMNNATLNIVYNTSPITSSNLSSSTYATESAVLFLAGSVGLLQAALNTTTVLYVGTTPYYYAAVVYATTTNGSLWNVLNNSSATPPQYSVIRATKIA